MKKKTRDFVANLERACESARKIPPCCAATGPDHDLVTTLWKARDKWLSATTARLPGYRVPATASTLARAQSWPDCEAAYRLPDNRLLVLWCDFTLPEVMTEAEYLHRLATRCVDLAQVDEGIKRDVLAFRSATRNPPDETAAQLQAWLDGCQPKRAPARRGKPQTENQGGRTMSKRLSEDGSVWMYEDEDREDDAFTDEDLQNGLAQLITGDRGYGSEINWDNMRVQTYTEVGMMTYDKGLVITLPDGSEYQLTIVQRR